MELSAPNLIARVNFDSYTTGVRWSVCGDMCAVSTDTRIHVYDVSDERVEYRASMKHAECLYDWEWGREKWLVTTGRYQPVHLSQVQDNVVSIQSTYNCINHLDELTHAYSVTINEKRDTLICGLKGELRTFDISRPGRISVSHVTKDTCQGQNGIISCVSVNPNLPVIAAGSYDRSVGLYGLDGERLCVLRGQQGGVTQVTFSPDGGQLLTGGRKDNEIICWDLRQPGKVLWTVNRLVNTNQRISFTMRGGYLASANTDGSIRIWDTRKHVDNDTCVLQPIAGWALHSDAATGVSWHQTSDLLATCSGQRHFALNSCDDDADGIEDCDELIKEENSLVIWSVDKLLL